MDFTEAAKAAENRDIALDAAFGGGDRELLGAVGIRKKSSNMIGGIGSAIGDVFSWAGSMVMWILTGFGMFSGPSGGASKMKCDYVLGVIAIFGVLNFFLPNLFSGILPGRMVGGGSIHSSNNKRVTNNKRATNNNNNKRVSIAGGDVEEEEAEKFFKIGQEQLNRRAGESELA